LVPTPEDLQSTELTLRLIEAKVFDACCVLLRYEVVPPHQHLMQRFDAPLEQVAERLAIGPAEAAEQMPLDL